jgi:hypothetical protein
VRYEWYNSAKALLSSSVQTSGIGTTVQTNYVAAIVAPASTAYVKIRFDLYNGTGTTNPAAGAFYTMTNIMVTKNATNSFSTTRTNLVLNPSFEVSTSLWGTTNGSVTLARITTTSFSGSACLRITAGAAGANGAYSADIAVTGGKDYAVSAYVKAATTARSAYLQVYWYNASLTLVGTSTGTTTTDSTSAWTRLTHNATAPSTATIMVVRVIFNSMAVSETQYVDAVMVEAGSAVGTYFDGSLASAGTKTYAWSGTAHASTSTESNTAFDYADPTVWQNILGPTTHLDIDREMLNVGTLSAEIYDAMLDPAVADTIRPGRAIRLVAMYAPYVEYEGAVPSQSSLWNEVFTGTITNGNTVYEKEQKAFGKVLTRITVSAVDNIATLANQAESRGVAAIADLPFILEGKGVPWNVNDFTGQVGTATVVSTNDNASVVDQIAIARDTNHAYAWVDREGVMRVMDKAHMDNAYYQAFVDTPLTAPVVANGDFESADLSMWSAGATTTMTRTTTAPYAGTNSLKLTQNVGGTIFAQNASLATVEPGHRYRLSFAYKTSSVSTTDWEIYIEGDGDIRDLPVSSTWKTVSIDFNNANATDLYTYFNGWDFNDGDSLYIDNIVLEDITKSYSDINVDFNTDRCINSVTVKWLRLNPATLETEEVVYGPYVDQTSIDTWGVHAGEFTIHGGSESSSTIAAYAADILTTNGTPAIKCNNLCGRRRTRR